MMAVEVIDRWVILGLSHYFAESEVDLMDHPQSSRSEIESSENWWDYCPICNSRLLNQKCKYVCPNPHCNFFMSCSEFDR
jgi:hypothetical protein